MCAHLCAHLSAICEILPLTLEENELSKELFSAIQKHPRLMSCRVLTAFNQTCSSSGTFNPTGCYPNRRQSSAAFVKDSVNVLSSLTLQDSHQSCADTRHNVTEQPLFDSVDSHPADDWQERQSCILGTFGITAEVRMNRKTGKTVIPSAILELFDEPK